ncbi:MAG: hypothetical protein PHE83_00540 [Opitutaceae bacterium]|nr:hypothetical protein [Opitutaceae bacterium]
MRGIITFSLLLVLFAGCQTGARRAKKSDQKSLAQEAAELGLSPTDIKEIAHAVAKEGQVVWQFFKSKEPDHVGVCTVAYESLYVEGFLSVERGSTGVNSMDAGKQIYPKASSDSMRGVREAPPVCLN